MLGTQIRPLLWEDSTCSKAIKPVSPNYWVSTLEPRAATSEAHAPWSLCSTAREATARESPRTATRESPVHSNEDSGESKEKKLIN